MNCSCKMCPFRGCRVIPVTSFAASLDTRSPFLPTINCSQAKGNRNNKNLTEVINLLCFRSPFKRNPYSVTYMFKSYRSQCKLYEVMLVICLESRSFYTFSLIFLNKINLSAFWATLSSTENCHQVFCLQK